MQLFKSLVVDTLAKAVRAIVLLAVWGVGTDVVRVAGQEPSTLREEKLENLLGVIRDRKMRESDPKRFLAAIQELSRRRAVEAVDDLVGLLTYERDWRREERTSQGHYYTDGSSPIHRIGRHFPATLALAEIGKPALPALLKAIMDHDEASLESTNSNYTVRVILARHGVASDAFFEDAAERAPTREGKQRLLHALKTIEEDFRSE